MGPGFRSFSRKALLIFWLVKFNLQVSRHSKVSQKSPRFIRYIRGEFDSTRFQLLNSPANVIAVEGDGMIGFVGWMNPEIRLAKVEDEPAFTYVVMSKSELVPNERAYLFGIRCVE